MNTEQERADFEAWASRHYYLSELDTDQCRDGEYTDQDMQASWEAYQAGRAALQSQDVLQMQKDREDAERYRWLRLQRTIFDHACVTWNIGHDWVQMDGAELDAAIDHARRVEGR